MHTHPSVLPANVQKILFVTVSSQGLSYNESKVYNCTHELAIDKLSELTVFTEEHRVQPRLTHSRPCHRFLRAIFLTVLALLTMGLQEAVNGQTINSIHSFI